MQSCCRVRRCHLARCATLRLLQCRQRWRQLHGWCRRRRCRCRRRVTAAAGVAFRTAREELVPPRLAGLAAQRSRCAGKAPRGTLVAAQLPLRRLRAAGWAQHTPHSTTHTQRGRMARGAQHNGCAPIAPWRAVWRGRAAGAAAQASPRWLVLGGGAERAGGGAWCGGEPTRCARLARRPQLRRRRRTAVVAACRARDAAQLDHPRAIGARHDRRAQMLPSSARFRGAGRGGGGALGCGGRGRRRWCACIRSQRRRRRRRALARCCGPLLSPRPRRRRRRRRHEQKAIVLPLERLELARGAAAAAVAVCRRVALEVPLGAARAHTARSLLVFARIARAAGPKAAQPRA